MALPANFFTTKSVLIIDDMDNVRRSLKGMMEMLGSKDITLATNGEQALEVCLSHQFDFILCDFNLGRGKDGYQLFEELKLRKLLKDKGVFILISAETKIQILHGIVELQPDDYLLKPFSYKKLESRLIRAVERRKALGGVFDAILDNDYEGALKACDTAIKSASKYALSVLRLRAEVFIKLGHYQEASILYDNVLAARDFGWARLGKAVTHYYLDELPKAIIILKPLVKVLETRVEALNWLSNIYAKQGKLKLVEETLIESVKISPKNISRQRALANFSILNGDLDTASKCFRAVLANTQFSVHDKVEHHLNYAHCLLDKAQSENELQRAKSFSQIRAILKNLSNRPDKAIFFELEKIVLARISILREDLNEANVSLLECDQDVVISSGKDSILQLAKAWLRLGNYDKYEKLMKIISQDSASEDIENISGMLSIRKVSSENDVKINKLRDLNQQAITLYKSSLFQASTSIFLEAFKLIPNNLQLALNLAQSITKGWPKNESDTLKKTTIKRCMNIIESQPLENKVKARYESFEAELKQLIA